MFNITKIVPNTSTSKEYPFSGHGIHFYQYWLHELAQNSVTSGSVFAGFIQTVYSYKGYSAFTKKCTGGGRTPYICSVKITNF